MHSRLQFQVKLVFLVAFFFRRVGGSAVFSAAVIAQAIVIAMYVSLNLGYLWYNVLGCVMVLSLSAFLEKAFFRVRRLA